MLKYRSITVIRLIRTFFWHAVPFPISWRLWHRYFEDNFSMMQHQRKAGCIKGYRQYVHAYVVGETQSSFWFTMTIIYDSFHPRYHLDDKYGNTIKTTENIENIPWKTIEKYIKRWFFWILPVNQSLRPSIGISLQNPSDDSCGNEYSLANTWSWIKQKQKAFIMNAYYR